MVGQVNSKDAMRALDTATPAGSVWDAISPLVFQESICQGLRRSSFPMAFCPAHLPHSFYRNRVLLKWYIQMFHQQEDSMETAETVT